MQWYLNLRLNLKLAVGFALIVLLTGTALVVSYLSLSSLQTTQVALAETYQSIISLGQVGRNQVTNRQELLECTLGATRGSTKDLQKLISTNSLDSTRRLQAIRASLGTDPLAVEVDRILELRKALGDDRSNAITALNAGNLELARQLCSNTQESLYDSVLASEDELSKSLTARATTVADRARLQAAQVTRLLIAAGVASLLLALVMVAVLSRLIADPLRRITSLAMSVAEGDLTVEVPPMARRDEAGQLNDVFRRMVATLRNTTAELRHAAQVLATSANDILSVTTEVATGATETAASVAETSTTVAEVRQTAKLASQKAGEVMAGAQAVAQTAEDGREAVSQTVAAMGDIRQQVQAIAASTLRLSEQSHGIAEITAAVNDLTDQINLLAVNAAIEAARAGEHGRGFAVVAHEIRSLADQSKQATAQIRAMLGDVQKAVGQTVMATEQGTKSVEAGTDLAARSGAVIESLAAGVANAAESATQISVSSQQQMAGMDQVVPAMESIKQASDQNVLGTQQAQLAARGLHELGQNLNQLIAQFRV